jgi:hypothetical protein
MIFGTPWVDLKMIIYIFVLCISFTYIYNLNTQRRRRIRDEKPIQVTPKIENRTTFSQTVMTLPRDGFDTPYPKNFLESQFPSDTIKQERKDQYIDSYMNTGVHLAASFFSEQEEISVKEPASFTPYPEDYVLKVARPPEHPYPRY